jgi:hypothetical protein
MQLYGTKETITPTDSAHNSWGPDLRGGNDWKRATGIFISSKVAVDGDL